MLESLFESLYEFDATDEYEEEANRLLALFLSSPIKSRALRFYRWKQAVIRAVYCTTDPKEIPLEDLLILTSHTSDDHTRVKYAEKIRSPITAIRAYCYNCQGCDISGVRNCTAMHCALYPFRMGRNPFYGKLADADSEVVEDIEEDAEAS